MFLPEPVTSAPLVFGSSPGDGGLSVRQRQELDVLATWAKERPGTQIRIIAVATSDEPSSFAPVNAKVAAIIERLRDAKIAADRIASVTRVPYPDEDPLAPGAVAVGLVRPETPQRGAGAH